MKRHLILAGLAVVALASGVGTASAAPAAVSILNTGQVTAQDVPSVSYSEPDTVVEPDVAVSPVNPLVAVAVSHDGRYPDGGAVGISYSWTHDGGRTWHHQPVPGLTRTTGGPRVWARASDPIVAFGPDGDVYISTLLIALTCPSAVAVSRSTNGGVTFGAPVLAHYSGSCAVSDDKNTLTIDTNPASHHFGRIYQFWTPFLTDIFGDPDGSPQSMVYSDDHGKTWSDPVAVSAPHANTQNSTPMVQPDGTVVDAYIDYGSQAQDDEDTEFRDHDEAAQVSPSLAASGTYPRIVTAISTDGGQSFHPGGVVTTDVGEGPSDIRCCLDSATVDGVTGKLYTVWNSTDLTAVKLSSSTDGVHWSRPVLVNQPLARLDGVNVDVAARAGTVAVSYGLTGAPGDRYVQQYVAVSKNSAASFAVTVGVGPVSNLKWAARAPVKFPGDYTGTALSRTGRLYVVWCVSGRPTDQSAKYHQVVFGATLQV